MQSQHLEIKDKYDREFINIILEIENRYKDFPKSKMILIDRWVKKFCEVTTNTEWKKNRNLHALFLLDQIMNNRLELPYTKSPTQLELPILNKVEFNYRVSSKIKSLRFDNDIEIEKFILDENTKGLRKVEFEDSKYNIEPINLLSAYKAEKLIGNSVSIQRPNSIIGRTAHRSQSPSFKRNEGRKNKRFEQLKRSIYELNEESLSKRELILKQKDEIRDMERYLNELENTFRQLTASKSKASKKISNRKVFN